MGRILPGIEGIIEAAWTNTDNKNYQRLFIRLKKHLLRCRPAGIYYYKPFTPQKHRMQLINKKPH